MAGASHRTIVGRHLLVIVDHRVVGFASFGPARDSDAACDIGQLYAINLDPDVWGRGLGRALLNVTDRLRELGYVEAVLWVVPDISAPGGCTSQRDGATTTSGVTRGVRCRRVADALSTAPRRAVRPARHDIRIRNSRATSARCDVGPPARQMTPRMDIMSGTSAVADGDSTSRPVRQVCSIRPTTSSRVLAGAGTLRTRRRSLDLVVDGAASRLRERHVLVDRVDEEHPGVAVSRSSGDSSAVRPSKLASRYSGSTRHVPLTPSIAAGSPA